MHQPEATVPVATDSRPPTPDSPLASSLHQATATIDDITVALSNFSRAPSPDPPNLLHCCCGRPECEHTEAWLAFKTKLEGRLILSAEVGQALLRKHEAYVRRQEPSNGQSVQRARSSSQFQSEFSDRDHKPSDDRLHTRVAELLQENTLLEKRLNVALVNSEIAEASHKTVAQELQEARATIARLTVYHARSIGWDTRLNVAVQEKEDMRQERDSERERARVAEAKGLTITEKHGKLQSEVRLLNEELEQQKQYRSKLSEEILRDARARLEMMQQSQLGHTIVTEDVEITKVMESLVADNEALKRDTAELQNLLAESREDVRALREEVEESKANVLSLTDEHPRIPISNPTSSRHHQTFSSQSSFAQDHLAPLSPTLIVQALNRNPSPYQFTNTSAQKGGERRPHSLDPAPRTSYEPLTPETAFRPLSPAESNAPSNVKPITLSSPQPRYPASHVNFDVDNNSQQANTPDTPEKPKSQRKPLFLLTQSRAVQTENWVGLLGSSPRPSAYSERLSSTPPLDGRSESSSLTDTHSSTIAALVDRVNALYNRIAQADVLTLTNRLKRQHLTGADVSHVSRSTVSAILSEVGNLRNQFRAVLEDDKIMSTCTRRDLRALLKLFKDMFAELGQMRVTLNDVVLDPAVAVKVREAAMDPSKVVDMDRGRQPAKGAQVLGGWIAPITKLFGSPAPAPAESKTGGGHVNLLRKGSSRTPLRPPARVVPKQGPALAASTTTVNVEFSGAAVGRAVSNTTSTPSHEDDHRLRSTTPGPSRSSRAVMGIFAGAPRPHAGDPWVMVSPKVQRRAAAALTSNKWNVATLRAPQKNNPNRLSRNVDAVIDSDSVFHGENGPDPDFQASLLERTLRPRGLSDSSIHSTFVDHDHDPEGVPRTGGNLALNGGVPGRQGVYPDKQSVLQSLSSNAHIFKPPELSSSPPSAARAEASERAVSPRVTGFLPHLASWAATHAGLDADMTDDLVGSVREESAFHRSWGARDVQGRDV